MNEQEQLGKDRLPFADLNSVLLLMEVAGTQQVVLALLKQAILFSCSPVLRLIQTFSKGLCGNMQLSCTVS